MFESLAMTVLGCEQQAALEFPEQRPLDAFEIEKMDEMLAWLALKANMRPGALL